MLLEDDGDENSKPVAQDTEEVAPARLVDGSTMTVVGNPTACDSLHEVLERESEGVGCDYYEKRGYVRSMGRE